jgi:putative FmdB family regulatory protein
MPRYSYECHACKSTFDAVHHHEEKLQECALCKDKNITRVISKIFIHKKNKTTEKVGTKVKDTIAETVEEIKKYKKHSTKEKGLK